MIFLSGLTQHPLGADPTQAFAKLKTLLRCAAARTVEELWGTIGSLLDRFSADECARYLANSGYPRSA